MTNRIFYIFIFSVSLLRAQTLNTSLTACYALNGTGAEPVNFLTGTLSAVTPTLDRFNNANSALSFGGSTVSFVQLPNSPLIKPTTSLSISVWIRPNGLGLRHLIYAGNGCGSYFEGYCVALDNVGSATKAAIVKTGGSCSSNNQGLLYGATTVSAQTWCHIGAYFGTDSIKLYVNGVLDGAMPTPWPFVYSSQGVVIGGTTIGFFNYPFAGSMDNLRFYNRKLSGQEFNQLYNTDPSCTVPMVPTNASFNAPDTVCVNQPVSLQNTSTGSVSSYYWGVCNSTVAPAVTVNTVVSTSVFNSPVYMSVNKDNNDYYSFVTNHIGGSLTRLFFGNSLSNTPTVTSLGNFSGNMSLAGQIYIHKEGTAWHGLVVGGGTSAYLAKLSFGSSLANTPTLTNMGNFGGMSYPHNIHVFETGSSYYGLVINQTNNSMTRLHFGSSITNTPTAVNMSASLSLSLTTPSQMAVVNHAGNWHIFVCNDSPTSTLTRLDFGNSLLNVPTASVIGNPGGLLNGPRGIVLIPECDGFRGYIANRINNQIIKVNIAGGATGAVTLSSSGISATLNFPHDMKRVRVGDTTLIFVVNASGNNIIKLKEPACLAVPSSTLQNPAPLVLNTPGTYTVSLATNENNADQGFYCKKVTVIGTPSISAVVSSSACANVPRTLTASGASSYTWYPGNLVGSVVSITPAATTVYTVVGAVSSCTAIETVTVIALPGGTLNVTASPPSVCQGNSSTLTASGATSYSWQPGNSLGTSLIVTPFTTTIYTVSGTHSLGCVSSKTIAMVVNSYPTMILSPATPTVCSGSSVQIVASGASGYTWQPVNISGASVTFSPTSTSIYTVTGVANNCATDKTVQIVVVPVPTLVVSASSNSMCVGGTVALSASGAGSYTWNPGNVTSSSITVSPSGNTTYTLEGSSGNCSSSETLAVTVFSGSPLATSASPSNICSGSSSTLTVSGALSYSWQPGNLSGAVQVVTPFTSTNYTVSAINAQGCLSSAVVDLTVRITPALSVNPPLSKICVGSSTVLNAAGATSYTWMPGNVNSPSVNISPTANSVYTLIGSMNGCVNTSTILVEVFGSPVGAIASSNTLCTGGTATLSATGASPGGSFFGFLWLPGSYTTATVPVSPSVSTVYTLTGSHSSCAFNVTVGLTVFSLPNVSASSSSTAVCQGGSATLTGGGALSYTWQPGNITAQNTAVTPNANAVFTLSGSNSAGCINSATTQITVNPLPLITITPPSPTVCAASMFTLTASGAGTYTWLPSNNVGSSHSSALTSNAVYTVNGLLNNCPGTTTVAVAVNPSPTLQIIATSSNVCLGTAVTMTVTGADTYTWIYPPSVSGSVITVTPTTSTLYQTSGTNSYGCSGLAQAIVLVAANPTINTTIFPGGTLCSGNSYTVSASGATSYSWDPPNVTGQSLVVNPSVAGSIVYTVTGMTNSCSTTVTRTVNVNPTPVVNASISPSVICNGEAATLSASGATNYIWYVPSATTANNFTVIPSASATYTVLGYGNGCSNSKTVQFTVNPLPVIAVNSSSNPVCSGGTIQLSGSGATSYTWLPGNQNTQVISETPLASITYTLHGTNTFGCKSSTTHVQTVNPVPSLTLASNTASICAGSGATLFVSGATAYTTQPGNLTGNVINVAPPVSTVFTITGTNGLCESSLTFSLPVVPLPVIVANAFPASICSGGSVTLSAGGAATYTWLPGNQNSQQLIVSPASSQIYTVSGSLNGCEASATTTVSVTPTPTLGISASSTSLCAGDSLILTASGAASYTWLPGGSGGPTLVSLPSTTTVYSVTSFNGNCSSQSTIAINVSQRPVIDISASDATVCANEAVVLQPSGAQIYTLQPGNNAGTLFTVYPQSSTVYSVVGSVSGCTSSASVLVFVVRAPTLIATVPAGSVCAGDSVSVQLAGGSGYFLNGVAVSGSVVVVSPQQQGSYTVTATNEHGCSDSLLISIPVVPIASVSALASPSVICSGKSAVLTATGAQLYNWLPVNSDTSAITVSPTTTTTYTLVSTSSGCTYSNIVMVEVIPCDDVVFGLSNAAGSPQLYNGNYYLINYTVVVVNQSTVDLSGVELNDDLRNTFPHPCTYTVQGVPILSSHNSKLQINQSFDGWSDLALVSSQNSTLTAGKNDTLLVSVLVEPREFYGTVKNWIVGAAFTPWNLQLSDSSNDGFMWDPDNDGNTGNNNEPTISELKPITLFVPDGFSPDGDGRYDELVVKGMLGRNAVFTVFNRWGNKVYETSGSEIRWDGYSREGKGRVPPSTYYYVLEFADGEQQAIRGFIAVQY